MQQNASQPAFHFMSVCHLPFASVGLVTGLAFAHLVSR
jgi:hypothetical protein